MIWGRLFGFMPLKAVARGAQACYTRLTKRAEIWRNGTQRNRQRSAGKDGTNLASCKRANGDDGPAQARPERRDPSSGRQRVTAPPFAGYGADAADRSHPAKDRPYGRPGADQAPGL